MNTRACGECRLCCKLPLVRELEKPPGDWCRHACKNGCNIYPDRPKACVEFECSWLVGQPGLEEGDRPDRIGVIFIGHEHQGSRRMTVFRDYKETKRGNALIASAAKIMDVVVVEFGAHNALKE